MSSKTIQIFLTDADINGVKIADLSNSTARVYVVPRDQINYIQSRPDLSTPALYMLFDDERTTVYVGESESFQGRVSSHLVTKDFWKWAVVCIAHGEGMDKAQVKFLESHAVQKAIEIGRFNVQNRTSPVKNNLHEFRLAETLGIFEDFEMLVTTLGFNVFEPMKDVSSEKHDEETATSKAKQDIREYDTIICPATGTGLVDAFQKKSAWWAVRIGQENISKFKHVGLYEGAPISAIRYYARITGIEPYPDKPGKYLIHHDGNIIELQNHIVIDKHPELSLYGPRYYKLEDMLQSKSMAELTDRAFGSSYQGKSGTE
ncbi:MAG TPA: GIY-YIG nuclease family protein [Candidatus Fimivivens sp.]|nr:GIY-YIG nuclease family protein [Candidatus Fimivivens sp.]